MNPPALVVMAAGLGSRFGGTKQLVPVGPAGEVFFDFAISDARQAGVERVVMVVRRSFAAEVEEHVNRRHPGLEVHVVCQDEMPAPPRERPWGTAQAILAAAPAIDGSFLVVNADDYYGRTPYRLVVDALRVDPADAALGGGALAAYRLGATVPEAGTVTRAICRTDSGRLTSLVEVHGIARDEDGTIRAAGDTLPADTPVSLNLWGLPAAVLPGIAERWEAFIDANHDDDRAELLLPTVIGEMIDAGTLEVSVVDVDEDWIGVTNPGDLDDARKRLAELRRG